MGIFGNCTISLNDIERPFVSGDRYQFRVEEFEEDTQWENLKVHTVCETDPHQGKKFTLAISLKENNFAIKRKINFALCFFTEQELDADIYDPTKMRGKSFSGVAGYTESRKTPGEFFINWNNMRSEDAGVLEKKKEEDPFEQPPSAPPPKEPGPLDDVPF